MRPTAQGRSFVVALGVALMALAGCVGRAPRIEGPLPANLHGLEHWQAHGRLGISSAAGGGSGSFDWLQRGDQADVQIRGPVGIGSIRLELRGGGPRPRLKMETGDGQVLESDAAWRELEARLGAPVPAGYLRYWMLGVAAPGAHAWVEQQAESAVLEQSDWRIDYQRFSEDPGVRVPVRIRASSGDARVRIVVDRWRLGRAQ